MATIGNISLDKRTRTEIEALVNKFFQDNIPKLTKISKDYGLIFTKDIKFLIVSAREKYIFNYLSGAFGNKDLYLGAKRIFDFVESPKFLRLITNLSGRAIFEDKFVRSVLKSLQYFAQIYGENQEEELVSSMKSLCENILKELTLCKFVILVGVPENFDGKPSKTLLTHEVFHCLLAKNGIWFQGAEQRYDYLDEALADLLTSEFKENTDKSNIWFNTLANLRPKDRVKKIKEITTNLLLLSY